MKGFEDAYQFVLERERDAGDPAPRTDRVGPRVTNDPVDRGGVTNDGVTQRVYDAWRRARGQPSRSVEHLTESERRAIYREWWSRSRASDLAWPLSLAVFDYAVNSGLTQAGRDLQRALAMLGESVVVDGAVGPMTLAAARRLDPLAVTRALAERRRVLFDKIVARNPNQQRFHRGWNNRVDAVLRAAGGV